uniref:Uncharacterized protein n=1 Tax=Seriola dumerili TaxID=41447 RepID=A0A3B4UV56_SERDU
SRSGRISDVLCDVSKSRDSFHILTTVHDGYLFISGDLMKPRSWMLSIGKNVVMGPHDNILSGLAALFASFYNLNLQYPEDSSCTLEFIQRSPDINALLII